MPALAFEFTVHITGWGILATIGGVVVLSYLWGLLRVAWYLIRRGR